MRVGDEDRGLPCGSDLPHRPSRPSDDEIGRGERGSELVGERQQLVVVASHAREKTLVVALAAQVEHSRTRLAEGLDHEVIQARSPLTPAEDEDRLNVF